MWSSPPCTLPMPHCSQDKRRADRKGGDTWDLTWTDGTDDFVVTFSTETESFRYSNGVAQSDFEALSFQSSIVRGIRVNTNAITVVNVMKIPPRWQCVEAWYNDGKCDCGCGAVDRDCLLLTSVGEDAGLWDWSANCNGAVCCSPKVQHCVNPKNQKEPASACTRYVSRDPFTDRVDNKQTSCGNSDSSQTARERGCIF